MSRHFSYDYYNLTVDPAMQTSDLQGYRFEQLELSEKSQQILSKWYSEFNQEMNSTWVVPDIASKVDCRFYVLRNKLGDIVGAVANTLPSEQRFWFGRFYVWPQYRGSKASKVLFKSLLRLSKEESKELSLLVHVDNLKAIALYKKFGFKLVSEIRVLNK